MGSLSFGGLSPRPFPVLVGNGPVVVQGKETARRAISKSAKARLRSSVPLSTMLIRRDADWYPVVRASTTRRAQVGDIANPFWLSTASHRPWPRPRCMLLVTRSRALLGSRHLPGRHAPTLHPARRTPRVKRCWTADHLAGSGHLRASELPGQLASILADMAQLCALQERGASMGDFPKFGIGRIKAWAGRVGVKEVPNASLFLPRQARSADRH